MVSEMDKVLAIEATVLARLKIILHEKLPTGTTVYMFGSRATGKARPYSDVDIALDHRGKPLSEGIMTRLRVRFEFSDIPYKVDVVDLNGISESFRAAIQSELVKLI